MSDNEHRRPFRRTETPSTTWRETGMVPPIKDFGKLEFLTDAQREYIRKLRNKGEFVNACTRRDQIGVAMEELNINLPKEQKFSHATLARIFEIPRSSLEKQYEKYIHGVKKIGAPSVITDEEKDKLVQWLDDQISQKEYPTVDMITEFLTVAFGKCIIPNTLRRYLSSNLPQYKFVTATPLEDVRYNVNGTDIDAYYDILESKVMQVDFRFFFNIDETGEDEFVDTHAVRVLVPATANSDSIKIPVSRRQKRFTIIHTICTDGTFMDMYMILPRVTIESDVFTVIDKSSVRMIYQKNGFVTDAIFKDFWENWFLVQLRAKRKKYNYVGLTIVIMDNHRSHHKIVGGSDLNEKVTYIHAENLLIVWLVPHSSEQTQPLDLGIFAVQKRETQKQKKHANLTSFTNTIIRALTGMQKASTSINIVGAFNAAGIVIDVKGPQCTQILAIDRSRAHAVRHWDSYVETERPEGTRNIQLMNHNPEFPRFRIPTIS